MNIEIERALAELLAHCLHEDTEDLYNGLGLECNPEFYFNNGEYYLYQPAYYMRIAVISNVNPDLEYLKKSFELMNSNSNGIKSNLYVFLTDMSMRDDWNPDLLDSIHELCRDTNAEISYLSLEELLQRLCYRFDPEWFYEKPAYDEISSFVEEYTEYDMNYIYELSRQLDE